MRRFHFLFIFSIFTNGLFAQASPSSAGYAMLGSISKRDAQIWYHEEGTKLAHIQYWPSGDPVSAKNATIKIDSAFGYCGTFYLGLLTPGRKYDFKINQKFSGSFTTQTLWEWRTDPPAIHIAFGSCAYLNDPEYDRPGKSYGGEDQIFNSIAEKNPDAMIWLGDNVYFREGDWDSQSGMVHRYLQSREHPALQKLWTTCPQYAIWDDHDFGPNDSNGSFVLKNTSLEVFRHFWCNPTTGLDNSKGIASMTRIADIDFFFLDNRYHRTAAKYNSTPFLSVSHGSQILDEGQREWLINALMTSTASYQVICLGGQFLNSEQVFENFANSYEEKNYLLQQFNNTGKKILFLTGDRHFGEISKYEDNNIPIYDVTSSPLTSSPGNNKDEKNKYRVLGTEVNQRHFAMLNVTGPKNNRSVSISFYATDGKLIHEYPLSYEKK
jgi:alkaline phosphatase D